MKTQIEGKIRGKVQGVSFRDSTRQFAQSHGIDGIVRNEPDGSVYLEAEGSDEHLEALRQWLESGPSAADVDKIELREEEARNYEGFTVQT